MKLPEIFTLIGCPSVGELGDRTEMQRFSVCSACNRRKRPFVKYLDYRFDQWSGEDLVMAMDCYAVSDRLHRAIEAAKLTGARFEGMTVSKGDCFRISPEAYIDDLPIFHRLIVTGIAQGPELWWFSSMCKTCGLKSWEVTDLGIQAQTADIMGRIGLPREIYADSWQGHDVFNLEDPGPSIVTQKFARIMEDLGVIEVQLHPAKWVKRA